MKLRELAIIVGVFIAVGFAGALTFVPAPHTSGSLSESEYNAFQTGLAAWANGQIGNTNVTAADPIAYSKLTLTGSIIDADIASVSVTKFTSLKAIARTPASNSVLIKAGTWIRTDGTGSATLSSDTVSPTFATPSTNSRIDILLIADDGTRSIIQGKEASSPLPPAYPGNLTPICEVFMRTTGGGQINDTDVGNSYIYRDDRPLFAASRPGPGLRVTSASPPSLAVKVAPGSFLKSSGNGLYVLTAAATVSLPAAPTANPRIDLLTVDDTGSFTVVKGTEAASPVTPSYPTNRLTLAEIFERVSASQVLDFIDLNADGTQDETTQSFIRLDSRPMLKAPASTLATLGSSIVNDTFNRQDADGTAIDDNWENPASGVCTITYQPPVAGGGTTINMASTSGNACTLVSKRFDTLGDNGFIFEARVKFSVGGPTTIKIGVSDGTANDLESILFEQVNTTTMKAHLDNNTGPALDTNFTVTSLNDVWHVYRIEADRDRTAPTTVARYYFDGALVASYQDTDGDSTSSFPIDADDPLAVVIQGGHSSALTTKADYVIYSFSDTTLAP